MCLTGRCISSSPCRMFWYLGHGPRNDLQKHLWDGANRPFAGVCGVISCKSNWKYGPFVFKSRNLISLAWGNSLLPAPWVWDVMRCGYCSQVTTKSGYILYYCITKSEGFPQLSQRPVLLVREIFQTMMSLPQWKGTLISVDVWLMVWSYGLIQCLFYLFLMAWNSWRPRTAKHHSRKDAKRWMKNRKHTT